MQRAYKVLKPDGPGCFRCLKEYPKSGSQRMDAQQQGRAEGYAHAMAEAFRTPIYVASVRMTGKTIVSIARPDGIHPADALPSLSGAIIR